MFEEVKVLGVVVSVRKEGKHIAFNDPEYLKWLNKDTPIEKVMEPVKKTTKKSKK